MSDDDLSKEVRETFGRNVSQYCQLKNVTLEQLHIDTKLSYTYLSAVRNGKKNISITNAAKIAACLNVPLSLFFVAHDKDL